MNSHNVTQFPKSAIERLPFPISIEDLTKAIEVLIALTDLLEPDPDLEPDLDGEPGTWTENQNSRASCSTDDENLEDNGDYEPSLLGASRVIGGEVIDDLELDECNDSPEFPNRPKAGFTS